MFNSISFYALTLTSILNNILVPIICFPQINYKFGIRDPDLFYLFITARISSLGSCFLCEFFCKIPFSFQSVRNMYLHCRHDIQYFFFSLLDIFPLFSLLLGDFSLINEYIRFPRLVHPAIYR
jgi:hypothetical protein